MPRFLLMQNFELTFSPHSLVRMNTYGIEMPLKLADEACATAVAEVLTLDDELSGLTGELAEAIHAAVPVLPKDERAHALTIRRHVLKHKIPLREIHAGASPSWPGGLAMKWQRLAEALVAARARAKVEFEAALGRSAGKLRELLSDEFLQDSLYFSSQGQAVAAASYAAGETSQKRAKYARQLERGLTEHLVRGSFNTTPRELMAGVGLAQYEPGGAALAHGQSVPFERRRAYLSRPVLERLARVCSSVPWRAVVPRANPTLSVSEGKLRFWAAPPDGGAERLLGLPADDLILRFVEACGPRELTAEQVVNLVYEKKGGALAREELEGFYLKLCKAGVLIGHLEIPYEEHDGLAFLSSWLERQLPCEERARLLRIQEELALIADPQVSPREKRARAEAVAASASQLCGLQLTVNEALVNDCVVAADLPRLGDSIAAPLMRALRVAAELTDRAGAQFDPSRATLGLLKTLAGQIQTGGDIALLELYNLQRQAGGGGASGGDPFSDPFISGFFAWLKSKGRASVLDLDDPELFKRLPERRMSSEHGHGTVDFHVGVEPGCGRPLIVVEGIRDNAYSGTLRFESILGKPALGEWLHSRLAAPPESCALSADVVALSGTRADSALQHATFQTHALELPWARTRRNAIPLNEVFIRMSEREGAHLVWRKPGREDVPLRVVYNSILAPKMGVILLFLKYAGWTVAPSLGAWYRRGLLRDGYLPRLTVGGVVLRRRSWLFTTAVLRGQDGPERFDNFLRWSERARQYGFPRHIVVKADADSPLWIDFHSPFSVDVLDHLVRSTSSSSILIEEMLPLPEHNWRLGYQGRSTTQYAWGFEWRRIHGTGAG